MGRRRGTRATATVATVVAVAAGVLHPATPAAALAVTSVGTEVTAVLALGDPTAEIACTGGTTTIGRVAATPPVPCATVTRITVVGTDSQSHRDRVRASGTAHGFPALTGITYDMRGGDDHVIGSVHADTVLGGSGQDAVTLPGHGADDPEVAAESVLVEGTDASDAYLIGAPDATGVDVTSASGWDVALVGWRSLAVYSAGGADTIDARALTNVPGPFQSFTADGGTGDDTLWGAPLPFAGPQALSVLAGGSGANVLHGGPGGDGIVSRSRRDTITDAGGGVLIDDGPPADSGGRTVDVVGPATWEVGRVLDDVAVRTRLDGTTRVVTTTLQRPGQQRLGPAVTRIELPIIGSGGSPPLRAVHDLAPLPGTTLEIRRSSDALAAIDVVVPSGTWTFGANQVTFSDFAPIVTNGAAVHVRAPFVDPEERYAHRLLRDLEVRIPSAAERRALADRLDRGEEPGDIVRDVLDAPVERGLAIDRAYATILGRPADAGGHGYWSDRLGDGLIRRKMRASFFGAPEYLVLRQADTIDGYVLALYIDLLGRTGSPSEVAYWTGEIEGGMRRGTLADRFLNTPEARVRRIRDAYLRFADREPTAAELASWDPILSSSRVDGELALLAALAQSPAYIERPDA